MKKIGVFLLIFCLSYVGSLSLFAQNNQFKNCFESLQKARQEINKSRLPNQSGIVLPFDPVYQQAQQIYQDWSECVKGTQLPTLSFKTLNGESYDTSSLAGKILVINFWFMKCAPCRSEFPAFNKLVEEYKGKNILFLGFTPDKIATLKPDFFQQNRFDFLIIPDGQLIANDFFISGYPTTYIVDQQGNVQEAWIGFNDMDKLAPYRKAKAILDTLLTRSNK